MDGFFNLNKPIGMTSNFALKIFRQKTGLKKSGYVGTLDPFAEGVLPIAYGKNTKLIESISSLPKEYTCTALFGIETDTEDKDGKQVNSSNYIPNDSEITHSIKNKFMGRIIQSPSVYSAIKINGKRLCDIARSDKFDSKYLNDIADSRAKEIDILEFNVLSFPSKDNHLGRFFIKCSKGTYIRKLISDLARSCNSCAHLISLQRVAVGNFRIEDSYGIDDINSGIKI